MHLSPISLIRSLCLCEYVASAYADCLCIHVSRLPESLNHNVSADLSSVLIQRVFPPTALFSELSQGVKQEHITAEDGSMLSGLAEGEENVEMLT